MLQKAFMMVRQESNSDKSRMELVKSHIARGFYDRPDIIEATAGSIVKSQALHLLLEKYDIFNDIFRQSLKCARAAKISEIKRKIEDGYYDDPNYLAELAEKIIKKMGLE